MTLSSKQQQLAEVLHLKGESDEKSVHLQVLQILHILCFTDVNSETEIHFFLVKFMDSTSEDMNQKHQVFEFLIQGALRELISGQYKMQTADCIPGTRCRLGTKCKLQTAD